MKALTKKIWLMAPLAILAAACNKKAPDDAALKNDLALASQQFVPNQVMSPTEQGLAATSPGSADHGAQRGPSDGDDGSSHELDLEKLGRRLQ